MWRFWEALAEAGGVGDIMREKGTTRDSGKGQYLNDKLKGMM